MLEEALAVRVVELVDLSDLLLIRHGWYANRQGNPFLSRYAWIPFSTLWPGCLRSPAGVRAGAGALALALARYQECACVAMAHASRWRAVAGEWPALPWGLRPDAM